MRKRGAKGDANEKDEEEGIDGKGERMKGRMRRGR